MIEHTEATEGADWNAHLINSETTNLQWSSSDHIVPWAWLFWFSWRPVWAHRKPQHTFCPEHFLAGFPVSLNAHRWDATPGGRDRDGRQVWASQGGCVPGQGSTPGVHRLPARSVARLAPSPALCPSRDAEPWLAALLGQSGRCSGRRYLLLKGFQMSWQRSTPGDLGQQNLKRSTLDLQICARGLTILALKPTANLPLPPASVAAAHAAPPHRAKPVHRGGGWRVALPPLAECRCEVVETGCQKLKVKAGLEPVSSKKHMLTLFIFPVMFAISNKNK